jgi:hypothetical protein
LHDLHGIADIPEESPEVLTVKLSEMNQATDRIPIKTAYLFAMSLSNKYVASLRLRFLRAEGYNPKNASERMVRYFDTKCELFGKDKLVKDVDLDDLSAEDMAALKSGFMMLLDEKDRSGRMVLYAGATDKVSLESRVRKILALLFYQLFVD